MSRDLNEVKPGAALPRFRIARMVNGVKEKCSGDALSEAADGQIMQGLAGTFTHLPF